MVRETKAGQQYRYLIEGRTKALLESGEVGLHAVEGEEYFYRPGELLVAPEAVPALIDYLAQRGIAPPAVDEVVGVGVITLPADADGHEVLLELRKVAGLGPDAVGPHHVLFGTPKWFGSPARPPAVAKPVAIGEGEPRGAGVLVAVIDTGQAESSLGGAWESGHVRAAPDDLDPLDADADGTLDFEAGHGTFIAGIIAQVAPGAEVLAIAALSPSGITDDLTAARAVLKARAAGASILNLSFGGYAEGDAMPLALLRALDAGCDDSFVVVAAAGNDGLSREFFPAAMPGVVAVAALNASGRRAGFSNFGPWVEACADGDRLVSTFVTGKVMTDSDGDGQQDVFEAPFAHWSGTSFAAPQVAGALAVRMAETGESAADATQSLIRDPALVRLPGIGTRIVTTVPSHRSGPGLP